jgi:hypothetical protein
MYLDGVMMSSDEKLSRPVSFRLTESDFLAYKKKFAAAGVKQSQFFRDNVLSNRTLVVAKAPSPSTAQRAVFLLAKASNNLNQLAHRAHLAHLSGILTAAEFASITGQLQSLNSFLLDQVDEAGK